MPALAAHEIKIEISDDDITYDEICGINDVSYGPSRELLDDTDFCDTSGARSRITGLRDASISMSGDYYAADTAQARIRTAFDNATSVYVKILWDGTNGQKLLCAVESHEINGSVDGKVEWSADFQADGTPTAVP